MVEGFQKVCYIFSKWMKLQMKLITCYIAITMLEFFVFRQDIDKDL